eukprot:COSAG01_NODE_5738_length_4066_cov_8.679859_4_plen_57_part_00
MFGTAPCHKDLNKGGACVVDDRVSRDPYNNNASLAPQRGKEPRRADYPPDVREDLL